jgi:murein DD-endopeptidase MepM/ murein hydrolase activator NlpD
MNAGAIKYIGAAFSMRREIKVIGFVVVILCLLPVFAVVLLTQVGLDLVSSSLVTHDPQTHEVQIHDPARGTIVDTVSGPFVWPVGGPVTLEFGESDLPYQPFHTGIDIASPDHAVGTPVTAFMKGTVIYADETAAGYGKHVIIDHGHHITSVYGHLDSIAVTVGQEVGITTVIGTRGNTGWSTGPHTHFEIRLFDIPVNPRTFLEGNP